MVQHATIHISTSGQGTVYCEEYAPKIRELNEKRHLAKGPKRGFSMSDNHGDVTVTYISLPPSPRHYGLFSKQQPAISEHHYFTPMGAHRLIPASLRIEELAQKQQRRQFSQYPQIPCPRRSFSVMDYEPAPPNQPEPSSNLTILDLPSELHYNIVDQLDPMDSVCFGLAHHKLWAIHRRKYPKVPLSTRYVGPNDMEWAWRGAGPLVHAKKGGEDEGLARMRTKGQMYCRKCGISRCELHRHLRDWIPKGWEYCEIRESFGKPPAEGAKACCTRSSPKHPNRCGRHGGR